MTKEEKEELIETVSTGVALGVTKTIFFLCVGALLNYGIHWLFR